VAGTGLPSDFRGAPEDLRHGLNSGSIGAPFGCIGNRRQRHLCERRRLEVVEADNGEFFWARVYRGRGLAP
jgi:hypothetical protein